MQPGGELRVVIDLEPGTDRPQGWLTDPGGERHRFSGWLELASGVDAVRGRSWAGAADQTPPVAASANDDSKER